MKWIDIPPVWLAGALVLAWGLGYLVPEPGFGAWAVGAGRGLIVLGCLLIAAALWAFRQARTTPIPHQAPSALIDTGVFRVTRNPIYLADALILAGAVLIWRAALPLLLVPAFMGVIQARFIRAEEARLAAAFPEPFRAYANRVRRWL